MVVSSSFLRFMAWIGDGSTTKSARIAKSAIRKGVDMFSRR